jgi:uncharacterized membrane protein HdeD (DUF308 family)
MNEFERKPGAEEVHDSRAVLDIANLRGRWTWCAKLGAVLIGIGVFAIALIAFSGIDSVPLLSWLIVLGGIAESVHAFHLRNSGAFFFHLVPGIAGVPLGLLVATHPSVNMVTWMLVFACFFTVIGLFRLISALRLRFPGWSWTVFDSVITIILGCAFWTTSPRLDLRFFDVAAGASLVLRGWSSMMLGFSLRSSRTQIRPRSSASTTAQARRRTPASSVHS